MAKWLVSSVAVRGTSHDRSGDPCQDYSIAHTFRDAQILVLSDGAGSCTMSDVGSRAASLGFVRGARSVIAPFLEDPDGLDNFLSKSSQDDWRFAVEKVREFVHRAATVRGVEANKAMACTLLGAVIGRSSAVVIQIGDGAWVSESGAGRISCVTWPENGEFGNETYFVTQSDYWKHLQFQNIPKFHGMRSLTGFSDGVEGLCLQIAEKQAVKGFFTKLRGVRLSMERRSYEENLRNFLGSSQVTDLTDDDCSLVGAYRDDCF